MEEESIFSPEILMEAPPAQASFIKKEFSFMDSATSPEQASEKSYEQNEELNLCK